MKLLRRFWIVLFFLFSSLLFFRNTIIHHQIPFPSNLLASFYQPWASYKWLNYTNGPPNKPIGFDDLRIFYPLRTLAIDQIKHLQPPLWNPYNFTGNTLLGSYQSAIFHPLGFLFLLFPQIIAWSAIVMSAPILAGLCMYALLKKFSLSSKAALFGAITFAFSGFMIVWWEESFMQVYSALFLPLMILGVEELLDTNRAKGLLYLVAGLVFSILSGWFQMTFYAGVVLAVWILYRTWKLPFAKKQFPLLLAAIALSLLISAVHLVPSFEAYQHSARGTTDAKYLFDTYLSPLSHLVTIIAPDFFGNPGTYNYFAREGFYHERMLFFGIPQLILVVYLLFTWKRHIHHERFFLVLFAISLSLGFTLPTSWFLLYTLKLPFLSVIIPSRIFFITSFAAAVLAAYGVQSLEQGLRKKALIPTTIVFLVVVSEIYQLGKHLNPADKAIALRNLVIPVASVGVTLVAYWIALWKKSLRTTAYAVALTVALGVSLYQANKFLYFSDPRLTFPAVAPFTQLQKIAGYDRFWSYGPGYIESNFATQYRLFAPTGYDSFYIKRYGQLIASAGTQGKYEEEIPRADARIETPDRFIDILKNPYRARLLSLLGVKYILGTNGKEREEETIGSRMEPKLPQVWRDEVYTMYQYTDALPRVFLAASVITESDPQKILNRLYDPSVDLSQTVIVEEAIPGFTSTDEEAGTAAIEEFTPNRVTIHANATRDAILFFSDAYYPGWHARIDGKQTHLYRANFAFRAVVVPKGTHTITFEYTPQSFTIGLWGSGIGILLGVLLYLGLQKKR